jgi:Flp pilus assembly protein TadD
MDDQQRARRLSEQGYRHLRSGAWFEAVKVGHALRLLRHPAGFELSALGLAGMGELAEAIEALEEGVQVTPGAWELWDLLGVYRAERGDLDGALFAFEEALTCAEPTEELVHLHAAEALWAAGHPQRALARLALCGAGVLQPEGEALYARREALRADLHLDLNRTGSVEAIAERALAALQGTEEPSDRALRASLAELHAARAVACWRSRGEIGGALAHARRALALDETNGRARIALRRLGAGGVGAFSGSRPAWSGDAGPAG